MRRSAFLLAVLALAIFAPTASASQLVDRNARAVAGGIQNLLSRTPPLDPSSVRATLLPYWTWDRTVDDLHQVFARTAGGVA